MAVLNKYHFGGRVPPGAVNIMRGTEWGNPFVIHQDGQREEVVELYRQWLWARMKNDRAFFLRVRALHGKDLCCCCAPKPCHGHILEAAAAWASQQDIEGD